MDNFKDVVVGGGPIITLVVVLLCAAFVVTLIMKSIKLAVSILIIGVLFVAVGPQIIGQENVDKTIEQVKNPPKIDDIPDVVQDQVNNYGEWKRTD